MVFCGVEEVGHVEDQEGEIISCVDAWIYFSQKPFVPEEEALFYACARLESVSLAVVARTQDIGMGGMDVVPFIQLPFQIRETHQNSQVPPYV